MLFTINFKSNVLVFYLMPILQNFMLSNIVINMQFLMLIFLIIVNATQSQYTQLVMGKSYKGNWNNLLQNRTFKLPIEDTIDDLQINPQEHNITYISFFCRNPNCIRQIYAQFYYSKQQPKTQSIYIQVESIYEKKRDIISFDFGISGHWNVANDSWIGKQHTIATLHDSIFGELVKFEIYIQFKIQVVKQGSFLSSMFDYGDEKIHIELKSNSVQVNGFLEHSSYGYIGWTFIASALTIICLLLNYDSSSDIEKSKINLISHWLILQQMQFFILSTLHQLSISYAKYDTELKWLFLAAFWNLIAFIVFIIKFEHAFEKFTKKSLLLAFPHIICYFFYFLTIRDYGRFWAIEAVIVFLWQITFSMKKGGRGGLPLQLIMVIVVTRLPFMYLISVDTGLYRLVKPSIWIGMIVVSSWIVNVMIILVQQAKGGRFLIPKQIIPDYFNYYIFINSKNIEAQKECPICLIKINRQQQSQVQINVGNRVVQKLEEEIKVMRTPCNHIFHTDCLTDWIQLKPECPSCRGQLPPINILI